MEKEHYRQNLQMLTEHFPDRLAISVKEAATLLGADKRSIYSAINRVRNPLPTVSLGKARIAIPLAPFAKWLCG